MVASVPEDTRRTISTDGTRSQMASARRTSRSVGAPYEVPSTAARWTASTIAGWAWPAMMEPEDCTRRSEERRVGKGCGSTGRLRWSTYHENKKIKIEKKVV